MPASQHRLIQEIALDASMKKGNAADRSSQILFIRYIALLAEPLIQLKTLKIIINFLQSDILRQLFSEMCIVN